jgi:HEAT repeat protein
VLIGASDGSLRFWNFPADVASVIKKLENAPAAGRLAVLKELAPYGKDAHAARPLLLKMIADPDKELRAAALALLVQLGPPEMTDAAVFTKLLSLHDFPEGRAFALDGLAALGADAKPAIAALTEALKDTDPVVRAKAATVLGAIGPDAKPMAFEIMLGLLGDKDDKVIAAATAALPKLGKPEREHARLFAKLLTHANAKVRESALNALNDLGPSAADAGPALVAMLATEKDPALKARCLMTLAQAMPGSKEVLAAYTTALNDADAKISQTAADGLARIGTDGGALPALLHGLDSPVDKVVIACRDALDKGPITKQQVPLLAQALPGTKDSTRINVMALLAKLGPDAAAALPGIIEVLKVGSLDARKTAVTLVGIIGPPAKGAGPAIAARLAEADPAFKLEIAQTLAKIGAPEVKQAVPALVKGLKIDNPEAEAEIAARKQASEAVVSIGKPAVEALMSALTKDFAGKDKVNGEARLAVLQTLQAIGRPAYSSSVHQRLLMIQKEDPFPDVRKAARITIEKLQEK